MPKKKDLQLAIYEFHPQVALIRDFLGYVDDAPFIDDNVDDITYLKRLDPLEWKTTDHYRVLGLGKLRFRASEEEIRKAYRRRVLDHHPDKRSHKGEEIDASHDYFACITKAFEILGSSSKRFAYDCVDEVAVDDDIPNRKEIKENFYCLRDVFARNARWSKKQPMPTLGFKSTPIAQVHKFYDIWDEYETVRDYSYQDEEEKDKGEDRDHRRYLDKLNKAERAKKRASEMKRIRGLVIIARELDPRLKAEQEQIKKAKEEKKLAKAEYSKKRKEEELERQRLEAEAIERIRAQSEERREKEKERLRKEKEQQKQALKAQRKQFRNILQNNFDYFSSLLSEIDRIEVMHNVDVLCQLLTHVQLEGLNGKLNSESDQKIAYEEFQNIVKTVKSDSAKEEQTLKNNQTMPTSNGDTSTKVKWDSTARQCLVKAFKLFPPGTEKRWDVIATYLTQHVEGQTFTSRETLKYAKSLSNDDASLKAENNARAFENFSTTVKESDATKNAQVTTGMEAQRTRPWTKVEQKSLESALRTITPKNIKEGEDRWQKIADVVGTRTKKECILRYKQLAEEVRAKKAAIEASKVT